MTWFQEALRMISEQDTDICHGLSTRLDQLEQLNGHVQSSMALLQSLVPLFWPLGVQQYLILALELMPKIEADHGQTQRLYLRLQQYAPPGTLYNSRFYWPDPPQGQAQQTSYCLDIEPFPQDIIAWISRLGQLQQHIQSSVGLLQSLIPSSHQHDVQQFLGLAQNLVAHIQNNFVLVWCVLLQPISCVPPRPSCGSEIGCAALSPSQLPSLPTVVDRVASPSKGKLDCLAFGGNPQPTFGEVSGSDGSSSSKSETSSHLNLGTPAELDAYHNSSGSISHYRGDTHTMDLMAEGDSPRSNVATTPCTPTDSKVSGYEVAANGEEATARRTHNHEEGSSSYDSQDYENEREGSKISGWYCEQPANPEGCKPLALDLESCTRCSGSTRKPFTSLRDAMHHMHRIHFCHNILPNDRPPMDHEQCRKWLRLQHFPCHVCGQLFETSQGAKNHTESFHRSGRFYCRSLKRPSIKLSVSLEGCSDCRNDKKYESRYEAFSHLREHHFQFPGPSDKEVSAWVRGAHSKP